MLFTCTHVEAVTKLEYQKTFIDSHVYTRRPLWTLSKHAIHIIPTPHCRPSTTARTRDPPNPR